MRRGVRAALSGWSRGLQTTLLALVTLAATFALSACTTPPRLATSADEAQGGTYSSTNIAVRNAGGGVLRWTVATDNPHVTLRNQFGGTVTGGSLGAGESTGLHIVIDGRHADPAVGLNATLHFKSNGGERQVSFSVGAIATCPQGGANPSGARPVGSQILVSYRLPTPSTLIGPMGRETAAPLARLAAAARAEVSSAHGLSTLEAADGAGPDLLAAPPGTDVDALVELLRTDPRVAAVQRNYYLELQWNNGLPTDPLYGAQWALATFGVPDAWAALTHPPERNVVLAVLDSGIDSHHPDLAAKVLPGFDFFRNSPISDPAAVPPGTASYERVAHGTHVAGIAAALGDAAGVIGVAFTPAVQVLPVKLFDDCGDSGRVDTLIKAIRWASGLAVAGAPVNENPADIINLSLGVPGRHPVLDEATTQAWQAGVLVVAASGNNSGGVLSPANGPHVLAVGSVDQDRQRSGFSNYGPELDLMAPGGFATAGGEATVACAASATTSILSTMPLMPSAPPELAYGCLAGTSMAAPFVAGVAALLFAQDATRTAADVRQVLLATALSEPYMSPVSYGSGIVCADAAVGAPTQCGAP